MSIPADAALGTRYILIKVDADGQVTETNEGNNVLAKAIAVVETPPPAPTGIAASDGTYTDKVRITWNAASGATSYDVWRDTNSTTSGATRIASSVTSLSYNDTSAVPETTYYYWVKAGNSGGTSGFSAYDTGYRARPVPATPTGVTASDGTAVHVAISWNASTYADSYAIYRHTSNSTAGASKIGDSNPGHPLSIGNFTSPTSFNDYTASSGVTYYYWVKAENSAGVSGYSASNSGYTIAPTPDLTLQNGSVSPTTLQRGQLFSGSVDVVELNNGDLPTGIFWTRFYYSSNATLDGADDQVGAFLKSSGPQSSPYHISLFNMSIPSDASLGSNRYILIKVDADSQVNETNEGNNVFSIPITIYIPGLDPPSPTSASCEYTLNGQCYNSGPFTISAFSASAHHYRVCRSNDVTGWGGCSVVMSSNTGSTFTVSGSHLPSDSYRRAYYFSACDSNDNCTAWVDNDEAYVYMDADGVP